jgi:hypothetical protein
MSGFARTSAGSVVDATAVGVISGLLYWALWGGRASSIVIFGVAVGLGYALLVRWRRRQGTGDMLVSRLIRR